MKLKHVMLSTLEWKAKRRVCQISRETEASLRGSVPEIFRGVEEIRAPQNTEMKVHVSLQRDNSYHHG